MLDKYALWKVIDILIQGKEYSVRELARKAKIGPSTSKACLDYLHQNNLLKKKVIGNLYQYSIDLKNPAARQIKNAAITKKVMDSGITNLNSQIYLCSNEADSVIFVFVNAEIRSIEGIVVEKTTEKEFEIKKKDFLDIIRIK